MDSVDTMEIATGLDRVLQKAKTESLGQHLTGRRYARFTEQYTEEINKLLGPMAEHISVVWHRETPADLEVLLKPVDDAGLAFLRAVEDDRQRAN